MKGATALLARQIAVRHTLDIDVYRAGTIAQVERDLRKAAQSDIGDWMRFELGRATRVAAGAAQAVRVTVESYIGNQLWAAFHVDLVADGIRMTATPEPVSPLTPIDLPGQQRHPWLAYPLVDHVADKTCAILERNGEAERPSTRYKDLVDPVAMTTSSTPAADQQRALHVESARRGSTSRRGSMSPITTCGLRDTAQRRSARRN